MVNYQQSIFSILSSRFFGYDVSSGTFIPKIIPFRILSVPNFARSDYDASGYEVSGFDATVENIVTNHDLGKNTITQGPYSDQTNSFSTRSGNTSMLEQNIMKFFAGGSTRAQDEDKCIFLITNHHNNLLPPKKHSK